jgi:hypothetical protein
LTGANDSSDLHSPVLLLLLLLLLRLPAVLKGKLYRSYQPYLLLLLLLLLLLQLPDTPTWQLSPWPVLITGPCMLPQLMPPLLSLFCITGLAEAPCHVSISMLLLLLLLLTIAAPAAVDSPRPLQPGQDSGC